MVRIAFRIGSWQMGNHAPVIRLFVYHRQNDDSLRQDEIVLSADDCVNVGLLHKIEKRYPAISFIGPNESERREILSDSRRGIYGLHSLHILTPLGILAGLFLVSAFVLSVILVEDMPARAVSLQAISRARDLLLGLSLVPAAFMALIVGKVRMTLRTDPEGLAIRRILGSRKLLWRNIEIGVPRSDVFNVYAGMFCYYSDRVNIVSSRSLVEIPLLNGGKKQTILSLNIEEAGPLFRELYYRRKVTLEMAQKTGAFL